MSELKLSFARTLAACAAAIGFVVLSAGVHAADCTKDTLCRIITDGKLKAGVVVDYKPWGYSR